LRASPNAQRTSGGEISMPTFPASRDLRLHYLVDDFADLWMGRTL
jgi:hypothetical protein